MFEKHHVKNIEFVDHVIHGKGHSIVDSGDRRGVFSGGRTVGFVRVPRVGKPIVFYENGGQPLMEAIRKGIQANWLRCIEIRPSTSPLATEPHWSDVFRARS